MEVVLRIDGKDRTFTQDFISGRMFRRTLEIQKLFKQREDGKNVIDESYLDTFVDYIVELFGRQFDRDTFYDGIPANKLIPTMMSCVQAVAGQASEAAGTDPN